MLYPLFKRLHWREFTLLLVSLLVSRSATGQHQLEVQTGELLQRLCVDCHNRAEVNGKLDLERALGDFSFESDFQDWRRVVVKLQQGEMPPEDADQPTDAEREHLIRDIRRGLGRVARERASDPGQVVLRRLTSAEHRYTLQDLTGLELDLVGHGLEDAVGGAGFTNVGFVQFVQPSTLERYLEIARRAADHAVIGAGQLQFFRDSGETGRELSAIDRILAIYRANGFRTAAGEGGEPYGLDLYPRAFFVAWRYAHRKALGFPAARLGDLAAEQGVSQRFAAHIWSVLSRESPSYPISEIVARFRALPVPRGASGPESDEALVQCHELYRFLTDWHGRFATANDDEAAPVLVEQSAQARERDALRVRIIWSAEESPEPGSIAKVVFTASSADQGSADGVSVIWRNARMRQRNNESRWGPFRPLHEVLDARSRELLKLGRHPDGSQLGPDDFVTRGGSPTTIGLPLPVNGRSAEMELDAEFDGRSAPQRVVKCSVSAGYLGAKGKSISALLADTSQRAYGEWRAGLADFGRDLPQISHREPAPSDRDPIPAPYDNTYNMPERNDFHYTVKYFRDDRFLVDKILDDVTRARLDEAWADLLTSFEYHERYFRFVCEKFGVDYTDSIAALDTSALSSFPAAAVPHVLRLQAEHQLVHSLVKQAEPDYAEEICEFAARAWRRPLVDEERQRLKHFYELMRRDHELNHAKAVRATLARVLVAPEFIYRIERPGANGGASALTDWELASRLSYFLWSSMPDDELRALAAKGQLNEPSELRRQARRMLQDPRARRLASEFFGQWFGFYRFDQFRGVDTERFPEFTNELKSAMYDEAITFFEHLVREDRPVREILFADYTFLNRTLAEHYGTNAALPEGRGLTRVDDLRSDHRGGIFGLGAVLTATSAPLRTSPVKRGDWVLRQVLGTPVPPPPADAGSIPADDALADGLTIKERLAIHRRDPSCTSCHVRIDPLGFALEHYDSVGRWREQYRNGIAIDDSAELKDGTSVEGPEGLRAFLGQNESLFYRNLSTKLVGYALGRTESVEDVVLINEMAAELATDARFSSLVERIVTSTQFRYHRGDP